MQQRVRRQVAVQHCGLLGLLLLGGNWILSIPRLLPTYHHWQLTDEWWSSPSNNNPSEEAATSRSEDDSQKAVSYSVVKGMHYQLPFSNYTQCKLGLFTNKYGRKPKRRKFKPKSILEQLNYTTYVNTSLKILVLGDSVALQLAQVLEEAMGVQPSTRTIYQHIGGIQFQHERVTISAPVQGGGALAAFRINGMFLRDTEVHRQEEDTNRRIWNRDHVQELLDHTYTPTPSAHPPRSIDSFDVMLFRIPHGWAHHSVITRESILESIELAHELFGVSTIILLTLHFNNNIDTMDDLLALERINQIMQDIADNSTRVNVVVLDLAKYTNQIMLENAKILNRNTSDPAYPMERLCGAKYNPSVAQVCASQRKGDGKCMCTLNYLIADGMHLCMESLGGRLVAAIGCQLDCVYNHIHSQRESLQNCTTQCSNQFLSLGQLEELEKGRGGVDLMSSTIRKQVPQVQGMKPK